MQRYLFSDVILLSFGRVCSVGQVIQIVPVWRCGAVHIVIPVADAELLIEAGFIGAHVGNPSTILIAHVENHAVKFQISVESNGSVSAVKIECDIRELSPPLFLKLIKTGEVKQEHGSGASYPAITQSVSFSNNQIKLWVCQSGTNGLSRYCSS